MNRNKILKIINKKLGTRVLILSFIFYLLSVSFVLAQWRPGDPIVPCGNIKDAAGNITNHCTQCELLHLVRNVIDFLMIGAAPVLATAFFIWAGINMILGGANPGMLSQGKEMFKNTIIGLLIVMLAWLITNTVIQTLKEPSADGNWWSVTCAELKLKTQ